MHSLACSLLTGPGSEGERGSSGWRREGPRPCGPSAPPPHSAPRGPRGRRPRAPDGWPPRPSQSSSSRRVAGVRKHRCESPRLGIAGREMCTMRHRNEENQGCVCDAGAYLGCGMATSVGISVERGDFSEEGQQKIHRLRLWQALARLKRERQEMFPECRVVDKRGGKQLQRCSVTSYALSSTSTLPSISTVARASRMVL